MDAILRALGYSPAFTYEKFRAEWSDGEGHVVLDHTPIGDIAEIEGQSRWIDRTARLIGLKPADYITKSYAELFFDWKRKTGSKAENMTFRECGKRRAAASRWNCHYERSRCMERNLLRVSRDQIRAPATQLSSAEACAGSGV